jgi:MFS family permease
MAIAVWAVRPTVSYKALALGASPGRIGLLAAATGILALFVAMPIGAGIDRRGEAPFLSTGLGLVALAAFLDLVAAAFWVLVLSQALLGLGQTMAALAGQSLQAHGDDGMGRDVNFARYAVVISLGQFLGPLLVSVTVRADAASVGAASIPDTDTLFIAAMLVAVLGALLTFGIGSRAARSASIGKRVGLRSLLGLLSGPGIRQTLLMSTVTVASLDIAVAYLPVLGSERGLSPAYVGLLLSTRAAASLVSRLGIPPLLRAIGRRRLLIGAPLVAGLGMIGLAPVVPPWAYLPLIGLIGLGLGTSQPMTASWVASQAGIEDRATGLSLRMTANRIGNLTIPAGIGLLAGVAGTALVFIITTLALVMSSTTIRRAPITDD